MVSDCDFYITFSSNTSLLIKIGIITINTFLPTRYKFAYTCSIKINALRFGKLLECIFWILAKPLYVRSMLRKSARCTKSYNTCSHHLSTERAQFFSTAMPDSMSHHQCFKSWMNWAMKFYITCHYSPDISPTDYHFFKPLDNILQGKHFHNQQEAENAFQEFIESWGVGFYTIGINKFVSKWQKCVECNGSYFD